MAQKVFSMPGWEIAGEPSYLLELTGRGGHYYQGKKSPDSSRVSWEKSIFKKSGGSATISRGKKDDCLERGPPG